MGTGLVQRCDKAAASPGKGFGETFTINRLGPPTSLRRCLGTTNMTNPGTEPLLPVAPSVHDAHRAALLHAPATSTTESITASQ